NDERQSLREDLSPDVVSKVFRHGIGHGGESADRSEAFCERREVNINLVLKAVMLRGAASSRTDRTNTVRVIEKTPSAITFRDGQDARQVGEFASHTVYAL